MTLFHGETRCGSPQVLRPGCGRIALRSPESPVGGSKVDLRKPLYGRKVYKRRQRYRGGAGGTVGDLGWTRKNRGMLSTKAGTPRHLERIRSAQDRRPSLPKKRWAFLQAVPAGGSRILL